MWLLRNENKGLIYRVQPGRPNFISRKDGDLLLFGDQSISRKHAELSVSNENTPGGVVLKDFGSKYGTFTITSGSDLTQALPNQPIILKDGDSVRFGIQWNTWRVEYFPLVVATSTLNAAEKTEVKEVVAALGGEVANDWQPCCTHLTMNKLTVTVKVVCALASGKPIVVPGYWKVLRDALVSTETKLPDCGLFVPPLAEALLNPSEVSFAPNPERGKLFSGYTFVAASAKQLARIRPMIVAAGGKVVEFSAGSWPVSKLTGEKTVLMQHTAGDKQGSQQSQVPDGYLAAARKLKTEGIRCVPESEIGLSILYCSMAQYCNPRFSPQSLFGGSASQNTQPITGIRPSTEDSSKPLQNGVMPGPSTSKKRALEDSSEEEHPSKKTNSEDLFSSEAVEVSMDKNSNVPSTSYNKTDPKEKRPIVNPSLDMFAPSGQTSGKSNQNNNSINKTTPSTSGSNRKPKQPVVNPSLDMFAPSGTAKEVNTSFQDMFATNESKQSLENKRVNGNDLCSVPKKQPKIAPVDEGDDAFSFSTNKRTTKVRKTTVEEDDDFSFASSRKTRKAVVDDDGDEFSFVSTKKDTRKTSGGLEDEFAFVSSKSSKKRNRQISPDGVDSNVQIAASTSRASTSKSAPSKHNEESDDLFAFAGGPTSKKKKHNGSRLDVDEPDAEVRLALFSKRENPSLRNASEPTVFEDPPDVKNLITYSKAKPCPVNIKEEVQDEEVDELARELHNATIVVVKPLVVARPKPAEVQPTSSGKNFKKFRKVTGLYKRAVPHIIGGSDLVPHYANCQNIDDILPPSPPSVAADDDWDFPNEKKKGKNR